MYKNVFLQGCICKAKCKLDSVSQPFSQVGQNLDQKSLGAKFLINNPFGGQNSAIIAKIAS